MVVKSMLKSCLSPLPVFGTFAEWRTLAASTGPNTKIDAIVRKADHGWCTLDAPTYDPNAADLSSNRLQQLLAALYNPKFR